MTSRVASPLRRTVLEIVISRLGSNRLESLQWALLAGSGRGSFAQIRKRFDPSRPLVFKGPSLGATELHINVLRHFVNPTQAEDGMWVHIGIRDEAGHILGLDDMCIDTSKRRVDHTDGPKLLAAPPPPSSDLIRSGSTGMIAVSSMAYSAHTGRGYD